MSSLSFCNHSKDILNSPVIANIVTAMSGTHGTLLAFAAPLLPVSQTLQRNRVLLPTSALSPCRRELLPTFDSDPFERSYRCCVYEMETKSNSLAGLKMLMLFVVLFWVAQRARATRRDWMFKPEIRMPTESGGEEEEEEVSTRWAVLVAGSFGFGNYRHQADVCHAYQILRRGGLKEENIVVFMYDDIAGHGMNPRPGVIINHPQGEDVYAGVPKDYTGESVTAANLYAVLLGNESAVKGGSGKVVNSSSNDRIFLYYSDHGGPGVLGMPNLPFLYAMDFIEVLKKKHAAKGYKEMVMYIEACESGSVFEGIMPQDLNIYITTASNAQESSFGTYCPGMDPPPPPEYITCLGDLYSVAWMEDSETHNLKKETIKQQYQVVKQRTSNFNTYSAGSHVMEYGSKSIKEERLYLYQGFDPHSPNLLPNGVRSEPLMGVINQRDADLDFLWQMYKRSENGSEQRREILDQITRTMKQGKHVDASVEMIGTLLFGPGKRSYVLNEVRKPGSPLVDDWECLKSTVRMFESKCGSLTQYGMKHMRAFANICNSGVLPETVEKACEIACRDRTLGLLHPASHGYSA